MTQRIIYTLFLIVSITFATYAQVNQWKGKKCAVVLTYDDALNVHLDNAIPLLDSLGLKATFYLSAYFPGCKDRLTDWKKAAEAGHELGNHTLFHPCNGKGPGRSWVSAERDLSTYSVSRMLDEIRMTNVFLQSLDGKTERSFAYPCGDMHAGAVSYHDKIHDDFVSARGVQSEMIPDDQIDIFNVGSYMINGETGENLVSLVDEAIKNNRLLVFLFHGVGGEHDLNVGLKEHAQLLHYLKAHEDEIWIAPFAEVTSHIKNHKK